MACTFQSNYLECLEISLLLFRRGAKFHIDLRTFHFMFDDTPKDYFYNYQVT